MWEQQTWDTGAMQLFGLEKFVVPKNPVKKALAGAPPRLDVLAVNRFSGLEADGEEKAENIVNMTDEEVIKYRRKMLYGIGARVRWTRAWASRARA
jgi:hypothetical protein